MARPKVMIFCKLYEWRCPACRGRHEELTVPKILKCYNPNCQKEFDLEGISADVSLGTAKFRRPPLKEVFEEGLSFGLKFARDTFDSRDGKELMEFIEAATSARELEDMLDTPPPNPDDDNDYRNSPEQLHAFRIGERAGYVEAWRTLKP